MNQLETQDDESTDLEQSCRDFTVQGSRGGILLFITDFFDRGGFEQALRYLLATGMCESRHGHLIWAARRPLEPV